MELGGRLCALGLRHGARGRVSSVGPAFVSNARAFSASTTNRADFHQKKLFTPGPLGVSLSTKEAMLRDLGSRDAEFINTVRYIRQRVVEIAGLPTDEYTCVPIQGSGTFAVEAALTTSVPRSHPSVLIIANGAYGHRLTSVLKGFGVEPIVFSSSESKPLDLSKIETLLKDKGSSLTNVAAVHCETSCGQINDVETIGQLVKQHAPRASYFIDAMSSFGGVPLDLQLAHSDFMVSSVNKCLEGVPGFSYVVCRKDSLLACKGFSRSLSLDVVDQYLGLEKNGQFRFTPPTHAILAFRKALDEFDKEGGVAGRSKRYMENSRRLRSGMHALGFKELLGSWSKAYIITSYHMPTHPNFNFEQFYSKLSEKGLCIYPGKVSVANCFRIGTIGHLFPEDIVTLVTAIRDVCTDMGIPLPLEEGSK